MVSPSRVASAATGEWQSACNAASKARSTSTQQCVAASSIAASQPSIRVSLARASIPTAPCAGAGSMMSIAMATPTSGRPSRSSPAAASMEASTAPAATLARRVSTFPRNSTVARSGRIRRNCATRRGELVPITAPRRSAAMLSAPISRSRTSARGSIAAMAMSAGRIVSTSFIECTAQSISPDSNARSSSLVHSALPPISASATFCTRSPVVLIGTISIASAVQPCARASVSRTILAWTSASGDPRVPSLNCGWVTRVLWFRDTPLGETTRFRQAPRNTLGGGAWH